MQGDVILAEPGAVIGFAGQRVIKQTIGQDLPDGFQTAEFLLEHGQVDDVVPRASLRDTTARLVRHMQGQRPHVEMAEAELRPSGIAVVSAPPTASLGGASSYPPSHKQQPDSDGSNRMSLTYDEALDFLFPRTTTIKFGLSNTRALLKIARQPARGHAVGPHRRHQREGKRLAPWWPPRSGRPAGGWGSTPRPT